MKKFNYEDCTMGKAFTDELNKLLDLAKLEITNDGEERTHIELEEVFDKVRGYNLGDGILLAITDLYYDRELDLEIDNDLRIGILKAQSMMGNNTEMIVRLLHDDSVSLNDYHEIIEAFSEEYTDEIVTEDRLKEYVIDLIKRDYPASHILKAIEANRASDLYIMDIGNSSNTPVAITSKRQLFEHLY